MARIQGVVWSLIVGLAWAWLPVLASEALAQLPPRGKPPTKGAIQEPSKTEGTGTRRSPIDLIVGGEVKKVWTPEALSPIADGEVTRAEGKVYKAISLTRLFKESGVEQDQIVAIRIGGRSVNALELKGEELTKLDKVLLWFEKPGWAVSYDESPGAARPRRLLRGATRIEVTLKK